MQNPLRSLAVAFAASAVVSGVDTYLPRFDATSGDWRSLGRQASSRIKAYLSSSATKARLDKLMQNESARFMFESMWAFHRQTLPKLAHELDQTAEGAGVFPRDLALMSFKNELLAFHGINNVGDISDDCSDVLVNEGENLVEGHNEDGEKATLTNTTYWIQSHDFEALASAGIFPGGAFGFNRHGLTVSLNALSPISVVVDEGCIGKYWMARLVLGANSISEAVGIVKSFCHTYGFSLNIGSAVTKELVNIEVGPGQVFSVKEIRSDSSYFHANAYRHVNVTEAPISPSSAHRLAAAQRLMPARSSVDVRRILGDQADKLWPIYNKGTYASGLFDLSKGVAYIWAGANPKTNAPLFKRRIGFADGMRSGVKLLVV